MLNKIEFDNHLTIHTCKLNGINNKSLVRELYYNLELSKSTMISLPTWLYYDYTFKPVAGKQCRIIVNSENVNKLRQSIHNIMIDFLKLDTKTYAYGIMDWVYISDNDNPKGIYHNHMDNGIKGYVEQPEQWTLTYYVQMPDNLEGDDGRLFLKSKTGSEFSILPSESELIIFPSDVVHKPETNKKSTKSRVVFATQFILFNNDTHQIKSLI